MIQKFFFTKYLLLKNYDYLDFIQFLNKQKPSCLLDAKYFAFNPLIKFLCNQLDISCKYFKYDDTSGALFISHIYSYHHLKEAWKDKDHYHVGKVLGYPECCVSAYIDKKLAHAHEHAIYHEFYKEDLWTSETADILMYPLYPFRIYNHIPCSWSCQKTLENNKIRKKIWNYQPDQLFLWIDQDFNFITKKPDSFYPTGLHTIEFS